MHALFIEPKKNEIGTDLPTTMAHYYCFTPQVSSLNPGQRQTSPHLLGPTDHSNKAHCPLTSGSESSRLGSPLEAVQSRQVLKA